MPLPLLHTMILYHTHTHTHTADLSRPLCPSISSLLEISLFDLSLTLYRAQALHTRIYTNSQTFSFTNMYFCAGVFAHMHARRHARTHAHAHAEAYACTKAQSDNVKIRKSDARAHTHTRLKVQAYECRHLSHHHSSHLQAMP